jgi:hypothetical protein
MLHIVAYAVKQIRIQLFGVVRIMTRLHRAAQVYAEKLKWPVIPLGENKAPNGRLVPNGVHNATTDLATIHSWWKTAPTAGVGLACGHQFFALDVDPRNGGDDALCTLETRYGKLPHTVTQLSGGGGQHYLFRLPQGLRLPPKLDLGLDLIGPSRYIVAAPSIHPDTKKLYTWDAGSHPLETPIADPPQWLIETIVAYGAGVNGKRRGVYKPNIFKPARESFLAAAFEIMGLLGREIDDRRVIAHCPWSNEHSSRTGRGRDSSAVILAPERPDDPGRFFCMHSHCEGRTLSDLLQKIPPSVLRILCVQHPMLAMSAFEELQKLQGSTGPDIRKIVVNVH